MSLEKDQWIVLRKVDYGESGVIATVFSRAHGRMAVMANGARKPKSPHTGLFDPGCMVEGVAYVKPSRGVQTAKEASVWVDTYALRSKMEGLALMSSVMELVGQLIHDGEQNETLFDTTARYVQWLTQQSSLKGLFHSFAAFQCRVADVLGFGIQPMEPEQWQEYKDLGSTQSLYLIIEDGSLSSKAVGVSSLSLTPFEASFIQPVAQGKGGASLEDSSHTPSQWMQLIQHLDRYLGYHVGGLKPRKSDALWFFES
ncbi:MAG: DNA repair protein RecO [Rhodothermaeota bacterium MED-G64]|nr:MAG: DNA repair protein RecO [Rhodothermaeota bacterium MED-G64]HBD42171.1 DNA repair protein RecO [Bacteroidota bacterium]